MRPALTALEVRVLLARAAHGTALLVWDGDRFHRVTPEAMRGALPRAADRPMKDKE